jgi:uncharacterized SAM-binding protein YcdF (DUF218 family)
MNNANMAFRKERPPESCAQADQRPKTSCPSLRETQRLWGIITRKKRWGLSWRGWLLLMLGVVFAVYVVLMNIYPFLAITRRANTDILVVEGWVHEYAIHAAAAEFARGSYRQLLTTGGPVAGTGAYTNDYNTSASVGADLLKKAGIPREMVTMVPSHVNDRDRTYSSAVALRYWLREHHMLGRSINVMTEDAHARRTRLLFEKALGRGSEVGIIAVPNPDYDSTHWWRYSEGVERVLTEAIAYIYARMFFTPPPAETRQSGKEELNRAAAELPIPRR